MCAEPSPATWRSAIAPWPCLWILSMNRLFAFAVIALLSIAPALAETVTVTSHAYKTECTEEDNVFITFTARRLKSFLIEAQHPPYIGSIVKDSFDPDFSNCHFGPAPVPTGRHFTKRKFILWENADYVMEGNTDEYFWRDTDVPVIVGAKTDLNVHLIQFYKKRPDGKQDQVLVIYPTDGHWRLKPLPVPRLDYNVYGVSFLIGPVVATVPHKPYVDYREVRFDPATLTFHMIFARGGEASVRIVEISQRATAVEVTFAGNVPEDAPFAAMRSMFVTPGKADVGEVRYRDPGGAEHTVPIDRFDEAAVTGVVFTRSVVSLHNTSAPDMAYRDFTFAP